MAKQPTEFTFNTGIELDLEVICAYVVEDGEILPTLTQIYSRADGELVGVPIVAFPSTVRDMFIAEAEALIREKLREEAEASYYDTTDAAYEAWKERNL